MPKSMSVWKEIERLERLMKDNSKYLLDLEKQFDRSKKDMVGMSTLQKSLQEIRGLREIVDNLQHVKFVELENRQIELGKQMYLLSKMVVERDVENTRVESLAKSVEEVERRIYKIESSNVKANIRAEVVEANE